jgi:DNA gyrase inhibitor GyrI
MARFEARIVRLAPMRVASVHAFGESPEREAWKKMEAWAGPRGLLEDINENPVFGFNNPNPSSDSKEYGYEFWIAVGPQVEAETGVEIKQFEGGTYAVTSCNLLEEVNSEFFQKEGYLESWKKIYAWAKEKKLVQGSHQALEKPHDPRAPEAELVLDLYLPIEE